MATKAKTAAPVVAAPAVSADLMAQFAAFVASHQAAPAPKAKAAKAEAPAQLAIDFSVLRQTGKSRPSSTNKSILIPVMGKLANGSTIGGTLWVKV